MLKVLLTSKGPYFEFICVTMPGLEPPLEEWLRAWFCKKNSMDCEMIITHYVLFWDHQMLNISMTVEIECSSKITS